jgi:hypothetical protein
VTFESYVPTYQYLNIRIKCRIAIIFWEIPGLLCKNTQNKKILLGENSSNIPYEFPIIIWQIWIFAFTDDELRSVLPSSAYGGCELWPPLEQPENIQEQ